MQGWRRGRFSGIAFGQAFKGVAGASSACQVAVEWPMKGKEKVARSSALTPRWLPEPDVGRLPASGMLELVKRCVNHMR